jgi:hypothetical protein
MAGMKAQSLAAGEVLAPPTDPPAGASPLWLRPKVRVSRFKRRVEGQRHKALDADLVRTIHGFDALLVLTGSTASANL